jgi:putative transposase
MGEGTTCFSWRGNRRDSFRFDGIIYFKLAVKTARCKLQVDPAQQQSLTHTLEAFAGACNQILAVSNANNVRSQFELQKRCYYDVKAEYKLTAN